MVAVYSSSFVIALAKFGDPYYFVIRQAIWGAMGVILLIALARTDYRRLRPLAVPIMVLTIGALLAVFAWLWTWSARGRITGALEAPEHAD